MAILVAVLGAGTGVGAFHDAWVFNVTAAPLAGAAALAIGPRPSGVVEVEPLGHVDRLPRLEPVEQRSGV